MDIFKTLDILALDGDKTVSLLYEAAGEKPLTLKAARGMLNAIKRGESVFIVTGFILAPFNKPETDGIAGAVLLAKALGRFGALPVIICPADCILPLEAMLKSVNAQAKIEIISKSRDDALREGERLIARYAPCAVIASECPAADKNGVYHNAAGLDITDLEAKCDLVFNLCREKGIFNIAIGDRGNEAGTGGISQAVKSFVPNGDTIAAAGEADNLLIGRASDLACYALIAAFCSLTGSEMFSESEHMRVLNAAVNTGAVDMSGRSVAAVDGISAEALTAAAEKMRAAVRKNSLPQ